MDETVLKAIRRLTRYNAYKINTRKKIRPKKMTNPNSELNESEMVVASQMLRQFPVSAVQVCNREAKSSTVVK